MDLVGPTPSYNLNDLGWLIHTRSENRPPARFGMGAVLGDALITHGCEILAGATIERSVLSSGVRVETRAVMRDSIILGDCVIEKDAVVERAILDKRVRIGREARVGAMADELKLAVVGKSSRIPASFTVGPGAEVGPDVIPSDLEGTALEPGAQAHTKRKAHEV